MPDASGTKAMTLAELGAICAGQESDASAFNTKLSKQRKESLKYYFAEPFDASTGLAAVPGRSSVVMQEVADTIDWIMPDLLKKFASGDRAVEFQPNKEEASAAAEQATAYVNYVFNHDNPGFMILHDFFQDALIQKNGIVKVWWDDSASDETRLLEGIPSDAFALLQTDPDIEIIAHTELPAAVSAGSNDGDTTGYGEGGAGGAAVPPEPTHDVRYKLKSGKCCVENVPPEEFLMARDGKRVATTAYCAHRRQRSVSDLIAEGFDPKQAKELPSEDDGSLDEEAQERRDGDDDTGTNVERSGVMRLVWVTEHYILVDYDNDGIAERRKVVTGGDQSQVLRQKDKDGKYKDCNDPWDGPPPFASITPKPKSHRFYGRSIADITMDLQRIFSVLTRQMLDNLYAQNQPRHAVSEFVNLDDYMSPRLGAFIRMLDGKLPGEGHIQPITVPFVGDKVIGVLEFFESVKENRTGVTKYNQGTDADSLNKTARGISQIMSAAQQRIELIARIFAETGVSDLFMLILQCVSKYQNKPRVIKISGDKWEPVDPRGWESQFRMQINVGLGTGNKDQQLMHLQTIGGMQKEMLLGGKGNLVTDENLYNTARKIVENAGLKEPELYFTDPGKAPPQPPKPDPEMAKVQQEGEADKARLALEDKKVTGTLSLQKQKQDGELALKARDQAISQQMQAQGQQHSQSLAQQGQEHGQGMAEKAHESKEAMAGADRQAKTDDVGKAIEQVGAMLQDFMQKQTERDQRQDQTISEIVAKLMPQPQPGAPQ